MQTDPDHEAVNVFEQALKVYPENVDAKNGINLAIECANKE